jgi:aflatoxin B1 aldehyde reductase
VIYNPLCGGLLTGKHKLDTENQEGRYSTTGVLGPVFRALYLNETNFKAMDIIKSAAEKHNLSMIEVALRWCVHHSALKMDEKGNDGVIIGVSKLEQLNENIRDLKKGPLPQDVVDALDKAWIVAKGVSPDPWHFPLVYSYDTQKALFG